MSPLICSQHDERDLTCVYQVRQFKAGFVLVWGDDSSMIWVKKNMVRKTQEIISDGVDWIHMHSSGECIDIYKKEYPDEYKKTCEYFKVTQTTQRENIFKFLDELRKSGITNMLSAHTFVMKHYPVNKREAKRLTVEWMREFGS